MDYSFDIGKLNFKSPLVSAPLAGISDIAFRIQNKRAGAVLVFSEMVSATALARGNKTTKELTKITKDDRPIAIQIFANGNDLKELEYAAKFIENEAKADILDFNLGCPAPDIVKNGCGSALLQDPYKVNKILSTIKRSIKIPLTAKIRLGLKENSPTYNEIIKSIEKAGVDALTVHARYVSQGYSGKSDWDIIREIKQKSSIPVIGNGDICNGDKAKKYLDEKYCDALMIGRASLGNPIIFTEINNYLEGKTIQQDSIKNKINKYFEYVELSKKYDDFVFARAKMHALFFTKGLPCATKLRKEITQQKNIEGIINLLEEYIGGA